MQVWADVKKKHSSHAITADISLGVMAETSLMIGDTTHDLLMAKNAGVDGLAVSFGAHPVDQLVAESPVACIDTPDGLRAWLEVNG